MSELPLIIWITIATIVGLALIVYQLAIQRQLARIEVMKERLREIFECGHRLELDLREVRKRLDEMKNATAISKEGTP